MPSDFRTTEISDLFERLGEDHVQRQLLPGFQSEFASSVAEQWRTRKWLSDRQLEILRDLVSRYAEGQKKGSFSPRRYEGYDDRRHR
jgi:hypothetical protein